MNTLSTSFRQAVLCLFVAFFSLSGFAARATDGPVRAAAARPAVETSRLAYVMAWRNAREATHHTDALRLTAALAAYLGLSDTSAARIPLERYLDNELAANPGRFSPTDAPLRVLQQLLREDLNGFQKTLSPILPDDAYGRYQELLDSLRLTAR